MRVYTEEQKERKRAYNKAYCEKNKDRVKAYKKAWQKKNKDKIKAYLKKNRNKIRDRKKVWEENNKDKIRAYSKTYREKNRDKLRARVKVYYENNKDKIRVYYNDNYDRIRVRKKEYRENNKNKINAWTYERKCRKTFATCKSSIKTLREMIYLISSEVSLETGIDHDVDHIIPISRGGINHEDFLMITTKKYNRQKGAKLDHPLPEMQYLILDDLVQLYLKEVS